MKLYVYSDTDKNYHMKIIMPVCWAINKNNVVKHPELIKHITYNRRENECSREQEYIDTKITNQLIYHYIRNTLEYSDVKIQFYY